MTTTDSILSADGRHKLDRISHKLRAISGFACFRDDIRSVSGHVDVARAHTKEGGTFTIMIIFIAIGVIRGY